MSCDKPSYQIGEKSYKLINKQLKYPTNITWSDINMELVDTTDNRVLSFLNIINDLQEKPSYFNGTDVRNNCGTYSSLEKSNLGKIFIEIQTLDKEGVPIEIWKLKGAWLKSIKQSQLNQQNDNISKISIALSYDWAEIIFNSLVLEDVSKAAHTVTGIDQDVVAANTALQELGLSELRDNPIDPIDLSGLSNLTGPSVDNNGFTTRNESRDRRSIEDNASEFRRRSGNVSDFELG